MDNFNIKIKMSLFLEFKQQIDNAFEKAGKEESKITNEILNMDGMSGKKTRHFYNNLLNKDGLRYLEIGTWKGSSVCSAMCGNKAKVVCIDNWSEFGGPKDEFLQNFNTFKGENDATFLEQDCYQVDISQLPKFNIYMYDGNHSKDSHYKALVHYYNCLDDTFIFIVDDWNWRDVRDGTYESFKQLNLTVLYEREIRTTNDDSHPPVGSEARKYWHNGIYVAILKKNTKPNYTHIWHNPSNLKILEQYKNKENILFLEIGSFEGYSANYFIDNFLTGNNSKLVCVDPWIKYSESTLTKMADWDNIMNENTYNIFIQNTMANSSKIIIKRGLSKDILPTLETEYDMIYIDGDHSEKAVWVDATLSFDILKVGGIMIFDDYKWNSGDRSPKNAIDKFIQEYYSKINILFINDQVGLQKTSN